MDNYRPTDHNILKRFNNQIKKENYFVSIQLAMKTKEMIINPNL